MIRSVTGPTTAHSLHPSASRSSALKNLPWRPVTTPWGAVRPDQEESRFSDGWAIVARGRATLGLSLRACVAIARPVRIALGIATSLALLGMTV
jgi:hypothetical protein